MGTLFYGAGRIPVIVEDVTLAHLKALVTSKQRRNEGLLVSWTDSQDVGSGRSSVWLHPMCDLHYKFEGSRPPQLDPAILEEMSREASQARGVELSGATLAHPPARR